jgi:hypothetical protein
VIALTNEEGGRSSRTEAFQGEEKVTGVSEEKVVKKRWWVKKR